MHCVIYAQHSREAGMDAHISKPFDVKTLCICLAAAEGQAVNAKKKAFRFFSECPLPFSCHSRP